MILKSAQLTRPEQFRGYAESNKVCGLVAVRRDYPEPKPIAGCRSLIIITASERDDVMKAMTGAKDKQVVAADGSAPAGGRRGEHASHAKSPALLRATNPRPRSCLVPSPEAATPHVLDLSPQLQARACLQGGPA